MRVFLEEFLALGSNCNSLHELARLPHIHEIALLKLVAQSYVAHALVVDDVSLRAKCSAEGGRAVRLYLVQHVDAELFELVNHVCFLLLCHCCHRSTAIIYSSMSSSFFFLSFIPRLPLPSSLF